MCIRDSPLIVLVVFFSKTYVFSILLCVFYSVLNMSATALFDTLPKTMLWLLPTPLTTFWSAGDMAAHGIKMDLEDVYKRQPQGGIISPLLANIVLNELDKWVESQWQNHPLVKGHHRETV